MSYHNEHKSYKREVLMRLIEEKQSDSFIAKLLDMSESWVRGLRKRYTEFGSDALILRKPGGSVCRLTDSQLVTLRTILDKGAVAYGMEGLFWDRKRVQYVIAQTFNISYDVEHISLILAKLNYTLQKPQKKDFRQCEEKVTTWCKETLPDIKKK